MTKYIFTTIILLMSVTSRAEIFECVGIVKNKEKDVEFLLLDTDARSAKIKVGGNTIIGKMTLARKRMNPERSMYTLYFKSPDSTDTALDSEYIFFSENKKYRIAGANYLNLGNDKHLESFTANNSLKCNSKSI